jgi:adenylate cyclase
MAGERVQRRLAAILAANVVGYTRLMERDEAGTLAALKSRRKEVLEPLIGRHYGRIFKFTGDGVLIEFASAVNAVEFAVELQSQMAEANASLPEDQAIVLRVGINLGDVVVEGADLFGDGVIVASRLEALAEPGGVNVSQSVFNHVEGKIACGFQEVGEQALKNVAKPIRIYRVAGQSAAKASSDHRPGKKPSIAVLPFTNMSGDPEQQYFSDGITEDLITELARYHSLVVIARNSSFQFRGPSVDIAAVRRALGVSYVVEGSVRKAGNRIRLTAQLIDAASQAHIWAERYDREIEDVFAVQDELTCTVAATLVGRVTASDVERARRKPTKEWAAYDYFLRGRECDYRYDVVEAVANFERAITLDPDYVHAHAWLANELCVRYFFDDRPETLDEAAAHARKAVALDENDPYAHSSMAVVALRQRQFERAGQHLKRATDLNPNDVNITIDQANWLMYVGRLEEAIHCLDMAQLRDPYPPTWIWEVRGITLYFLKRYREAIAALKNVRTNHFWMPMFLAAAYAQLDQMDDARHELAIFLKLRPNASLARMRPKIDFAEEHQRVHLLDGLRKAGLPK